MRSISLALPSFPALDRLRPAHASTLAQAAGVVLFAVLMAAGAHVRVQLWEVPFTLQTLAVYGAGLALGARNGLLSSLLYLAAGVFLPVFAGGASGPAYLLGATGGYLVALPLAAFVAGRLTERAKTLGGATLALVAASCVVFATGTVWLHFAMGHATWAESFLKGWWAFLPVDAAKIGAAALAYVGARRLG